MTQRGIRIRARPHAWSLLALLVVAGAACQASPEPTAAVRTMTVTIPVPTADKAVIDAAGDVFAKRLKAIGIGFFTVDTGDVMKFTMLVPLTFDATLVDAVLRRPGVFEFMRWPAGAEGPAQGDRVPATIEPLFDSTDIKSAVISTDSSGQPAIKITLDASGTEALATYTREHINGYAPLVLDGFVLVAAVILSPITGGELLITGPDQDPVPLAALAAILASGPLPAAWTAQP